MTPSLLWPTSREPLRPKPGPKKEARYRGISVNDDDRVGLNGDKTAGSHPAAVSNPSTSAKSEPANSTLLTPLRAKYHKFTVDG
jgi:hypothetical protein